MTDQRKSGGISYSAAMGQVMQEGIVEINRLREVNAGLVEALESAIASYRPSFRHPGIGRHDPHELPPPAWVVEARAAIAKAKETA